MRMVVAMRTHKKIGGLLGARLGSSFVGVVACWTSSISTSRQILRYGYDCSFRMWMNRSDSCECPSPVEHSFSFRGSCASVVYSPSQSELGVACCDRSCDDSFKSAAVVSYIPSSTSLSVTTYNPFGDDPVYLVDDVDSLPNANITQITNDFKWVNQAEFVDSSVFGFPAIPSTALLSHSIPCEWMCIQSCLIHYSALPSSVNATLLNRGRNKFKLCCPVPHDTLHGKHNIELQVHPILDKDANNLALSVKHT